jgi:hypothetical protein
MSSCFISDGYTLDCRNASTGGIKSIWVLGDSGNTISGVTYTVDNEVQSMSGSGTWYKFELVRQSSSFTEELQVNTTNQAVVFQPTVAIALPKLNQSLRNLWFDLIKQNEFYMIIQDNNDRYWLLGVENGLYASAGQMLSGLSYNDANGINLTVIGGEPNPSVQIQIATTLGAVMSGMTVPVE